MTYRGIYVHKWEIHPRCIPTRGCELSRSMQQHEHSKEAFGRVVSGKQHTRQLPIHWHTYEPFVVPVRPRCLKLPRSRLMRFLRQQVAR